MKLTACANLKLTFHVVVELLLFVSGASTLYFIGFFYNNLAFTIPDIDFASERNSDCCCAIKRIWLRIRTPTFLSKGLVIFDVLKPKRTWL